MDVNTLKANAHKEAEATLNITLRLLAQALPPERRSGGILCVLRAADRSDLHHVFHRPIGNPPDDSREASLLFSNETAHRIARNPGHFLSWQSRHPEYKEYQGGVRVEDEGGDWFAGFSGLTEEANECFVLIWFVRMRMMTAERAAELARTSNNTLFFAATVDDLVPLAA